MTDERKETPQNYRPLPTAPGKLEAYGKKLFRYLSGGGIAAFRRTVKEEEAEARQERFLAVASFVGIAWLVLWIF